MTVTKQRNAKEHNNGTDLRQMFAEPPSAKVGKLNGSRVLGDMYEFDMTDMQRHRRCRLTSQRGVEIPSCGSLTGCHDDE